MNTEITTEQPALDLPETTPEQPIEIIDPETVFSKLKIETMPFAQFAKIPTNAKQRDTELRAIKLRADDGGHLAVLEPEHIIFSIARDLEGNEMKLDGHTRTHFAEKGWLVMPESVLVCVVEVENMDEALVRYDSYDSNAALKTSAHNLQSAYRVNEFSPESVWIREAKGIKQALAWTASLIHGRTAHADKEQGVVELVYKFLPALEFLDNIDLPSKLINAPYLTAMIAIAYTFKDESLPFFEMYKAGNESVENGEKNSIHLINTYMKSDEFLKFKKKETAKASDKFLYPVAVFVNAFCQWHSNPDNDWGTQYDKNYKHLRSLFIEQDEDTTSN